MKTLDHTCLADLASYINAGQSIPIFAADHVDTMPMNDGMLWLLLIHCLQALFHLAVVHLIPQTPNGRSSRNARLPSLTKLWCLFLRRLCLLVTHLKYLKKIAHPWPLRAVMGHLLQNLLQRKRLPRSCG